MELYTILSNTNDIQSLQSLLNSNIIIQKSLEYLKHKCSIEFHTERYAKCFLSAYIFLLFPEEYFDTPINNISFANVVAELIVNTNDSSFFFYLQMLNEFKEKELKLFKNEFQNQLSNLNLLNPKQEITKKGVNLQKNLTNQAYNYFNK